MQTYILGGKERSGLLPECTLLSVGAVSMFGGYSLFPNILKYNIGHNDFITESNANN